MLGRGVRCFYPRRAFRSECSTRNGEAHKPSRLKRLNCMSLFISFGKRVVLQEGNVL